MSTGLLVIAIISLYLSKNKTYPELNHKVINKISTAPASYSVEIIATPFSKSKLVNSFALPSPNICSIVVMYFSPSPKGRGPGNNSYPLPLGEGEESLAV